MQKIASFTVDHNKLTPGIYVSRRDGDITTYDLRTRIPNSDNFMDNPTMHSVEHMIATFIRNSEIAADVIYFGPMGCQTGFYLLVRSTPCEKVLEIVLDVLGKIIAHSGEMPGASRTECGNYRNLSANAARVEAKRYLDALLARENDFKYRTK